MKEPKKSLSVRLPEATIKIIDDNTTVFFTRADIVLAALINFDSLSIDERTTYLKLILEPPKQVLGVRLSQLFIDLVDGYTTTYLGRADVVNAAILAFDVLDVDKRYQYLNEAKVKNHG